MLVYYHLLFLVSILNPSSVITETVENAEEQNSTSINKGKNTTRSQVNISLATNKMITPKTGKWQVGRVSRKQYEIINMLWRKTKIFIDTETTGALNNSINAVKTRKRFKNSQHVTLVNQNPIQESFQLAHPNSKVYSSTSSYIEFYYLDELDERKKHKDNTVTNNKKLLTKAEMFDKIWLTGKSRSPFFLFRANDATCKTTTRTSFSHKFVESSTSKKPNRTANQTKSLKSSRRHPVHETSTSIHNNKTRRSQLNTSLSVSLPNSTVKDILLKQKSSNIVSQSSNIVSQSSNIVSQSSNIVSQSSNVVSQSSNIVSQSSNQKCLDVIDKYTSTNKRTATVNDRIRFFDIYDSYINTPATFMEDDENKIVNSNTVQIENNINTYEIDHTAKDLDKNRTRYVKKYVNHNNHSRGNYEFYNLASTVRNHLPNPTLVNQSSLAFWSDFPFVAVYVYEPTQVRCDSASISPHWLVASAWCLNRHHKDIKSQGRSAFVAYCSGNWRHPGRIAYVKQSLIHPRFHPKDNSRRQLYNIGAIQVINSMADTCSGWAPISLMSHQFTAARDGTLSTALGWGLDRYDMRHSLTELPKHFTLYKGLVYSDSCPGNTGYSVARRLDKGSVKNVYCLALPPYTDEENDAVHGGMLLIGGKLIALYMQEERRRRGNQSAQYTGIWHLIPWLLDVATEPDEIDPFNLDM